MPRTRSWGKWEIPYAKAKAGMGRKRVGAANCAGKDSACLPTQRKDRNGWAVQRRTDILRSWRELTGSSALLANEYSIHLARFQVPGTRKTRTARKNAKRSQANQWRKTTRKKRERAKAKSSTSHRGEMRRTARCEGPRGAYLHNASAIFRDASRSTRPNLESPRDFGQWPGDTYRSFAPRMNSNRYRR